MSAKGGYQIRQANPNDVPAIKALVCLTLHQCIPDNSNACDILLAEICTLLDAWIGNPNDVVHLVCEQDSNIIGVVFVSDYNRLNLLSVHPSKQKTGIGRALLDSGLKDCRQRGKSGQVTLNSSSYAVPFYLKYGFTPNGSPEDKPGGCVPLIIRL